MPIQDKTRANRLGFAYFALLAVTLIVQYTVAALLRRFFPALTETDGYTWLLSLVPLYGVALPVCLALLRNCPAEPIGPRPMRLRFWWLALLLSFGLMFFGNLIGNALMMLIAALRGVEMINPVQELILDADPLWTALATVIAAPLGEEFIFRRLIIDHARSFGELPAILLSAAMFGAFHQNFYQFFYAFFIGIVFGYVYVKTGRLRYTIALHAAINCMGGIFAPALLRALLPLLERLQNGETLDLAMLTQLLPLMLLYLAYAALLFGAAMAAVVIAIVAHDKLRLDRGKNSRTLWCAPTILAFFAFCTVMAIIAIR